MASHSKFGGQNPGITDANGIGSKVMGAIDRPYSTCQRYEGQKNLSRTALLRESGKPLYFPNDYNRYIRALVMKAIALTQPQEASQGLITKLGSDGVIDSLW